MSLMVRSGAIFPKAQEVGKILVFRTAQMPEVRRATEHLRSLYPEAAFSVLGTCLDHELFHGMQKFEIRERWITPRSYAQVRKLVEREHFDIAVMCLNSDHIVGYGRVSRVLRKAPARVKLVSSYTGHWYAWQHSDFSEGNLPFRWIVNSLLVLLYPAVALYLLSRPPVPMYLPVGQRRSAPRCEI